MRAVLVDAGGVLFNNVTESSDFFDVLAKMHHVDANVVLEHVDRFDADYETDHRDVHDVLAEGLIHAGSTVSYSRPAVDDLYVGAVIAYAPVFVALRRLKKQSDMVLALANNEARRWDELKDEAFGHLSLFDIIGSSWRLGQVKPTEEYFTRLLAQCSCDPDDAVLIDDNVQVVTAAREFGLSAVFVTDALSAARALTGLV